MKVSIRQNRWDAWKGYIGGRFVLTFGACTQRTAEQNAKRWLDRMNHLKSCEACKAN